MVGRRARSPLPCPSRGGGKAAHDPGSVRLRPSGFPGRGAADPAGPRGGSEDPVRRVQPAPAHQAPARTAGPPRGPPGHHRPRRDHRGRGRAAHRVPGDPSPDPREPHHRRPLPAARGRRGRHRRPAGPQLGHDRRLCRARGPGVGLAGRAARGQRDDRLPRCRRRPRDRGPRLLPRHVHDGDRADRGAGRGPHHRPPARARAAPTRSSSGASATSRPPASRRS